LVDWSYIGGFFDGEGNIWQKQKGGNPCFQLTNTNHEILVKIQNFIGFGLLRSYKKPKSKHKRCWKLYVGEKYQVLSLLKSLLPHIYVKKQEVFDAIEFLEKKYPLKKCKKCGKEFKPNSIKNIFCSRRCWKLYPYWNKTKRRKYLREWRKKQKMMK